MWFKQRAPLAPKALDQKPSLVSARQWMEWLEYWLPRIHDDERWVAFLVQSTINYHQMWIVFARRVRHNPNWDAGGGTVEDWVSCEKAAEERLHWFNSNKPSTVGTALVPRWANMLFDAVEGGLKTGVRLGREIDEIRRKGHLLVNVNPYADGEINNNPSAEEEEGG